MQQVQISDQLYKVAERRARAAGFGSVDAFVADRLQSELTLEQENFDSLFTPKVLAHLDRISAETRAGRNASMEQVNIHLAGVRKTWLKNHAG